eukprot:9470500-Pyramimonas_sp.AAC.1
MSVAPSEGSSSGGGGTGGPRAPRYQQQAQHDRAGPPEDPCMRWIGSWPRAVLESTRTEFHDS